MARPEAGSYEPQRGAQSTHGRSAGRYGSLDLWRGVACLLVLLNHSVFYEPKHVGGLGQWLNAAVASVALRLWISVPIFFVISGYCITAAIDRQRMRSVDVRQYFVRRFRRIFPPYWVVVGATVIAVGVLDVALHGALSRDGRLFRPWWFSPWQWLGTITLTELWRFHLFGDGKALFLSHAWTLCYEEQFYAVGGLLLLLCGRRWFVGAAVTTLLVAVFVPVAASTRLPIDGFFFDGSWIQFSLGIGLYFVLHHGGRRERVAAGIVFSAILAAALSMGSALLDPVKNQAQVYLIASSFALAALLLHKYDQRLMTAEALRPLLTCGLMCYSLYLVHLPVVLIIRGFLTAGGVNPSVVPPLVSIPLCAVPSIWVALRFHHAVERRFMNAPAGVAVTPMLSAVA